MKRTLILEGVKVYPKKDGSKGYEYHFRSDFSDYDKTHSECYGNEVFSEYSSQAFKVNVGDEVDVMYEKGFQGKAQLMDIRVVTDGKLKINK